MKKIIKVLLLAFTFVSSASANIQDAINEYYKENYEVAFEQMEFIANQGNGLAQWYLYWMYTYGFGTDKNIDLGKAWKEKGAVGIEFMAMQGNPEAQYWHGENLGQNYLDGYWFKESFEGVLVKANQGDPYYQGWLGEYYLYGIGVEKNKELGMSWLLKSAQGGDAYYQELLGSELQSKEILSIGDEESIKWMTKAAEQGNFGAINSLKEIGIDIDLAEVNEKIENEKNDSEKLLSLKDSIEESSNLSSNRIGKWFIGGDCNNITSEIVVLHDQIMQRPFSDDQSLNILTEINNEYFSQYFPLTNYGNLFFFNDNIIFNSNSSSDIYDYYFESLKFPELSLNDAYKATQLLSCKSLNNDLGFILLESDAIEFDKFIYSAKTECQEKKPIDCLKKFIDFADISNNNELSRAELTRFSRFVVKWLTLKGELQLNERMGASAASMIIAPALAEFIMFNYDYDNDDHINLREMTYDIVNITGSSELNNKIIRGYIEALDILSKSKKDATRFIDDLF